ncbi:hypothetical protein PWE35_09205 [Stenotrophomonas maltophilia]|uniref:hypothetical protein n=1 Tax=Stenotrophomonas maltophilia TaxID=40324 RepID=UPI00237F4B38|nr:hypothetical protein [Stenotrophomonas maltophilia]WDW06000.1 hypothetical protein PWE35_09205 [Stenotrophomonas maltophilia]
MKSGDDSAHPCDHPTRGGIGLTKRELFAAMVMQGFASDPDATGLKMLAESAVVWADALLAALEKSK